MEEEEPEPDFILAEVTYKKSSGTGPNDDEGGGIPSKLVHRICHEQYRDKRTKMRPDALTVLSRYVDVFVREAVLRTAYEKRAERERDGRGLFGEVRTDVVDEGGRDGDDDGWLEVDDLERVAVQLCLDF